MRCQNKKNVFKEKSNGNKKLLYSLLKNIIKKGKLLVFSILNRYNTMLFVYVHSRFAQSLIPQFKLLFAVFIAHILFAI